MGRFLSRSRRRLVAATLAVLFTWIPSVVLGDAPDDRLARLEAEVAELRAALEAVRAERADGATDERLTEIERRVEILATELEALRIGEAALEADRSVHGLGPAASKVYRRDAGVSIGGYGELTYQGFDSSRDDGAASGKTDELDLLRAIVYFGYKWNDRWLFNSEIEWEHATEGENGEVSVEFAYVDRLIRPEVNVRAGLVLLPVGLVNELHEPTVFHGVRRPGVESVILPSTWRENGVGLFGDLGGFSYRTYVVAGLDASGFSAAGIRGGRQAGSKSKAEDFGWVGRLDWTATPGLLVGGSVYLGDSGQGLADPAGGTVDASTRIVEGHLDWRNRGVEVRALWAQARLGDAAGLNRALGLEGSASIGERLAGGYVELGYDLWSGRGGGRALVPFVRWESYDTQDEVPDGWRRDPARDVESRTFGVSWKPFEQLVVKADVQDVSNGAGSGVDQVNLGLGWVF